MNTSNQTTARTVGGRRLTEGTAVFVGRNSFRMIPGHPARKAHQNPSLDQAVPNPGASNFDAPEESVVLSPPTDLLQAQTARIAKVTAQIVSSSMGPQRRALPIWVVAISLIIGASVALTAQAVMRESAHATTATKRALPILAATGPATTPVPHHATTPLFVRSPPIVAPAMLATPTLEFLPKARPTITHASRSSAISDRPKRARHTRSGLQPTAASQGRTRHATTKWADPFATKTASTVAATPATSPNTGGATQPRWVDPFAN